MKHLNKNHWRTGEPKRIMQQPLLLLLLASREPCLTQPSFFSSSFFSSFLSSSFSCPCIALLAFQRRTRYALYSIQASRGIANVTLVNFVLNFFSAVVNCTSSNRLVLLRRKSHMAAALNSLAVFSC